MNRREFMGLIGALPFVRWFRRPLRPASVEDAMIQEMDQFNDHIDEKLCEIKQVHVEDGLRWYTYKTGFGDMNVIYDPVLRKGKTAPIGARRKR